MKHVYKLRTLLLVTLLSLVAGGVNSAMAQKETLQLQEGETVVFNDFSSIKDVSSYTDGNFNITGVSNLTQTGTSYQWNSTNYAYDKSGLKVNKGKSLTSPTITTPHGFEVTITYACGALTISTKATLTLSFEDESASSVVEVGGTGSTSTTKTIANKTTSQKVQFNLATTNNVYFITNITITANKDGGSATPVDASWNVTSSQTVEAGKSITIANASNFNGEVAFSYSQEDIATASYENGNIIVTGLAEGSTTITFNGTGSTAYNDIEKTFTVNVEAPKPITANTFKQITSTADLTDGGEYIIVCEYYKYAMGELTSQSYGSGVEVNPVDHTIILTGEERPIVFTLTQNADDSSYGFRWDNKVLGSSGNSTKFTNTATNENAVRWTISFDAQEGYLLLSSKEASTRCVGLHHYTSNGETKDIFGNYASSNLKGDEEYPLIQLYKKLEPIIVTTAGYATYYTDKALEVPADEGIERVFTVKHNGEKMVVSTDYAARDVIPAETGFIVKAVANTYYFPLASTDGTPDEDNALRGSIEAEPTTAPEGMTAPKYYKLAKPEGYEVGFYYGSENGGAFTNGAHRAYLVLPEDLTGGIRGFSFEDDIFTTGIQSIQTVTTTDNKAYDLSGRRVQNLQKNGIYIVNGKKVIK